MGSEMCIRDRLYDERHRFADSDTSSHRYHGACQMPLRGLRSSARIWLDQTMHAHTLSDTDVYHGAALGMEGE